MAPFLFGVSSLQPSPLPLRDFHARCVWLASMAHAFLILSALRLRARAKSMSSTNTINTDVKHAQAFGRAVFATGYGEG